MVDNIRTSPFAGGAAVSSEQATIDTGIQKAAAASPAGISAVRDSFQTAAAQSKGGTDPTQVAQPAAMADPVAYMNSAATHGRTLSSHVQNQDLLRSLGDAKLDVSSGVKELNSGIEGSFKDFMAGISAANPELDLSGGVTEALGTAQKELNKMQDQINVGQQPIETMLGELQSSQTDLGKATRNGMSVGVNSAEKKKEDLGNKIKEQEEAIKKLEDQLKDATDSDFSDFMGALFGSDSGQSDGSVVSHVAGYTAIKKGDDDD